MLAYCLAPIDRASPLENRASKALLNAAAASALSTTTGSLSCRLRPDAEKFAAPVRCDRPLVALEVHGRAVVAFGADFDAGRLGQILKDLRGFGFGRPAAIEMRPPRFLVGFIFVFGAVDQGDVGVFKVRSEWPGRDRLSEARAKRGRGRRSGKTDTNSSPSGFIHSFSSMGFRNLTPEPPPIYIVDKQHRDNPNVDVLFEQMRGETVPQYVRRHALGDLRHLGCGVTSAMELPARHSIDRVASGEQSSLWARHPPPVTQ
jgi:hypothetical protein